MGKGVHIVLLEKCLLIACDEGLESEDDVQSQNPKLVQLGALEFMVMVKGGLVGDHVLGEADSKLVVVLSRRDN